MEATRAGVRRYDDRLPDWSPEGLEARRAWRSDVRRALAGFADTDLSLSQRLDRQVLLAEAAGQDVEEAWRWTGRAPGAVVEVALNGLNTLLARPDPEADAQERQARLLGRLNALPRLLAQGRALLDPALCSPESVEIARVACRGAHSFLEGLDLPPDTALAAARSRALAAVAEHATFVEALSPGGAFALGREGFERLLRERHGVDLTAEELGRYGRDLTGDCEADLATAARQVHPERPWPAQVDDLRQDHPSADRLLATYAEEAERARAFVEARDLVGIPAGERLEVRATQPFQRATMPLGYFDRTPPFAASDNLGILYITPVSPDLPPERQRELLGAHCHTAIRAICLHETYPGHHLQLWHAKLRGSAARRQLSSTLFAEGWGLYCEELMEEAGYYDTPALNVWRRRNALWRALRIGIDVGLHCEGLSVDEAASRLAEKGGLEPRTARGEVLRYTTSPTQPSSYVLGRDRTVALRRLAERREGPAFSVRAFHDRLLGYSTISPALIPDDLPAPD